MPPEPKKYLDPKQFPVSINSSGLNTVFDKLGPPLADSS